ncbi:MAG: DEAD/DEAH box helicase [Candidatus Latescibacterota bacterium]|jgi:ATP-dependent RNA helicase DeaD
MKFTELELQPAIQQALAEMGYEELTPIQEETIPPVLAGHDVVGLAETGSGKTAACAIPLIQRVDPQLRAIQVLILVPTRELALQYVTEVDQIARRTEIAPFAVFGGFDMAIQKAKLKHGVHILVATPGRLIDLIWNYRLDVSQVRTAVLDEADEMLKMGFLEDIDFIMSCMIQEHQTLLWSATMPVEIERIAQQYLKEPVKIQLNRDQVAPQSLKHHFRRVSRRERLEVLLDYVGDSEVRQAILFCNSRDGAGDLYRELQGRVKSVEVIHGGLAQERRTSIFNRFRQKQVRFMIATDVAGRGLDFSHVSHIINYDFPRNAEIYTHRTGRAGRMGREGTAVTFVGDRDLHDLRQVLEANRIEPVWEGEAPDLESLGERRTVPHRGRPAEKSGGSRRGPRRRGQGKAAAKA